MDQVRETFAATKSAESTGEPVSERPAAEAVEPTPLGQRIKRMACTVITVAGATLGMQ